MNADFILYCAEQRRKRMSVFAAPRHVIPGLRAKRKHGKRHATNKERSHEMSVRQAERQRVIEARYEERRRRSRIMSAYFSGELPDLSSL